MVNKSFKVNRNFFLWQQPLATETVASPIKTVAMALCCREVGLYFSQILDGEQNKQNKTLRIFCSSESLSLATGLDWICAKLKPATKGFRDRSVEKSF